MKIDEIPNPCELVDIPYFLSPSHFYDLQKCPLKVLVSSDKVDGALPPSPNSLFGLLLHHVREQLLKGRFGDFNDPVAAFEFVFDLTKQQMDELIRADRRTRRFAPLEKAIGRIKWNSLRMELRRWAARQKPSSKKIVPEKFELNKAKGDKYSARSIHSEMGAESWLTCADLRIRGRVDLIEETQDGAIEITEYKSGTIFDDNDKVVERHSKQLQLYALAAELAHPNKTIRTFIEGAERFEIPWTDVTRAVILDELRVVLDRFPYGKKIESRELARPGTCCRGCQLRVVCPAYLEAAPQWWPNQGSAPRPLPQDVWGVIRWMVPSENTFDLELLDDSDRFVRVECIDKERDFSSVLPNEKVFFFDLEPTEPTVMHGKRIQPRNFHELAPDGGLVYKTARALQVYKQTI